MNLFMVLYLFFLFFLEEFEAQADARKKAFSNIVTPTDKRYPGGSKDNNNNSSNRYPDFVAL